MATARAAKTRKDFPAQSQDRSPKGDVGFYARVEVVSEGGNTLFAIPFPHGEGVTEEAVFTSRNLTRVDTFARAPDIAVVG
jgi:hypothetical protein